VAKCRAFIDSIATRLEEKLDKKGREKLQTVVKKVQLPIVLMIMYSFFVLWRHLQLLSMLVKPPQNGEQFTKKCARPTICTGGHLQGPLPHCMPTVLRCMVLSRRVFGYFLAALQCQSVPHNT
jgi:hypothetical protein